MKGKRQGSLLRVTAKTALPQRGSAVLLFWRRRAGQRGEPEAKVGAVRSSPAIQKESPIFCAHGKGFFNKD